MCVYIYFPQILSGSWHSYRGSGVLLLPSPFYLETEALNYHLNIVLKLPDSIIFC